MDVSPLLTALLWCGAGLLLLAGGQKLPRPDAAMASLHSLGLPSGRVAARVLGVTEVIVAAAVVIAGGVPAAALTAVTYAVLTAVAARQRARQVDCGCFGVRTYPVSRLHLAVNGGVALAGAMGLIGASGLLGSVSAVATAPWSLAQVTADAGVVATLAGLLLAAVATGLLATTIERAGVAEAAGMRRTAVASGGTAR